MSMPQRRHFAAGDFLTRFPPGSPHEILIESPVQKAGWQARAEAGVTAAVFPGSAIRVEERYYEVIKIESTRKVPPRYLYYLHPWEDRFPIRTQFTYTREECLRAQAQLKKARQDSSTLIFLNAVTPFLGMLPARDQLRLQNTYGLDAIRATLISLIGTFLAGGALMVLTLVSRLSPGSLDSIPVLNHFSPLFLGMFGSAWFVESVLRIFSIKHDEPMGSFPVSVPLELFRAIRRHFDAGEKQKQFERMESGSASVFLNARDEVRVLENGDLEIRSILPKPDWSSITGIQYQDKWYGCSEATVTGTGNKRYRYVLRPVPEASAFRTALQYTPEEVRERYLQKRRRDLGTWVETFAPFWGLLKSEDQMQLQKLYGFIPMKFTAYTVAAIGIASGVNIVVSLLNMTSGVASPGDALWLLGAGYFFLESAIRFGDWMKNKPSGSVLGILIRPFAKNILRGY